MLCITAYQITQMNRILNKYLQSVLSPDEFEQFCDYINSPENARDIKVHLKTELEKYIEDDDVQSGNPELLKKIQQVITEKETKELKIRSRIYLSGLRIAAVLLLGIILSGLWLFEKKQPIEEAGIVQTVSVPNGAKTQFVLPDGSTVWLNSGSRLSYSNDSGSSRKLELQGEAYFDVVKSKIPFIVSTDYGSVRVLGTAFNVEAYPDDHFVTTLIRGSVKVSNRANNMSVVLSPGEQAQLLDRGFIKEEIDTGLTTAWKEGKLILRRESFPGMVKKLERWFNVDIELSGRDYGNLWFTGDIEDETLTEVLEMICKAAPVSYSYNTSERKVIFTPASN